MLYRFFPAAMLAVALAAAPGAQAASSTTSLHSEGGPTFVVMRPITLPVIQGTEVVRQITLMLTLELGEGRNEFSVDEVRPRLVQAFIDDLTKIYEKTNFATQTVDAVRIKKTLQASADRVLGQGVVVGVLIQQAMERTR